MARARNIKPGFFRNSDLAEVPFETRLLFIGLWTLADREGRLEDRPRQIKMELFPCDSIDVGSMLDQLQSAKFITRYEVDATKFIEVENFIKHQDPHYKEKASEIPPPPGRENLMRAVAVTKTQRLRILERDGSACKGCGSVDALCIDHIFPASRGGDSSDANLQVLCSACNTKKGNKVDGKTTSFDQRLVNVDPNLDQRKCPLPSDPLIPDSLIPDPLIPDSLIPDPLKEITAKTAPASPWLTVPELVVDGLSEDVANAWIAHRRTKKAKLTALAWQGFKVEAAKAEWDIEAAVLKAITRNWIAFDSKWVAADAPGGKLTGAAAEDARRAESARTSAAAKRLLFGSDDMEYLNEQN